MSDGVILSLGSLNLDIQFKAPRWPDPEETLPVENFTLLGGGKAANVAFLARRLGTPAWLLARVGDDALADFAMAPLVEQQVDLRGVVRTAGQHTGTALVLVQPGGHKGILLAENANLAWDENCAEEAERVIEQAPAESVLVVDFELPVRVARFYMQAASRRGMQIVVDPSPADRVAPELLSMASAVTPNVGEAEKLTGRRIASAEDAGRAAEALAGMGVALPFVKLGDGGCVYVSDGHLHYVEPPGRLKPVDTTGAGDAFTGALAVALLERRSVDDAARRAVVASQISVCRFGSQPSYPGREEFEQAVRNY